MNLPDLPPPRKCPHILVAAGEMRVAMTVLADPTRCSFCEFDELKARNVELENENRDLKAKLAACGGLVDVEGRELVICEACYAKILLDGAYHDMEDGVYLCSLCIEGASSPIGSPS